MDNGEIHFNVSFIARAKVTRMWPQTTSFEEKGEQMRNRTVVLLLNSRKRFTARPNGLTLMSCPRFPFSSLIRAMYCARKAQISAVVGHSTIFPSSLLWISNGVVRKETNQTLLDSWWLAPTRPLLLSQPLEWANHWALKIKNQSNTGVKYPMCESTAGHKKISRISQPLCVKYQESGNHCVLNIKNQATTGC